MREKSASSGAVPGVLVRALCTCDQGARAHSIGLALVDLVSYPILLLASFAGLIAMAPWIAVTRQRGRSEGGRVRPSGLSQRRALLVLHGKTFLPRMLELGRLLRDSGRFLPVFHLGYKSSWSNITEDVSHLQSLGFVLSADSRAFRALPPEVGSRTGRWAGAMKELGRRLQAVFVPAHVVHVRRRLAEVLRVLDDERPDVVVLSNDVPTWDTSVFVGASRLHGVPCVVAFSQTGPLEEASHVATNSPSLWTSRPWNAVASALYPQWIGNRHGRRFLMLPIGPIVARELLGVSMPQPWIESSSDASAVLIESEACLERGLRVGLRRRENLVLTGQPFHDVLHSVGVERDDRLAALYAQHGNLSRKPMVLTTLPSEYAARDNTGAEHGTYRDLVAFWLSTLVRHSDYHTIVSLHPSQRRADHRFVEDCGAHIARVPISEIMPLSHLYVASNSTTITMAIACGVPVVCYDAARYEQTSFDSAPGVMRVASKQEFSDILDRMLRDQAYYASMAHAQKEDASRWGVLDGRATARIIEVMEGLIEKREGRPDAA